MINEIFLITKVFYIIGNMSTETTFSILPFEMDNYQEINYSDHAARISRSINRITWCDDQFKYF